MLSRFVYAFAFAFSLSFAALSASAQEKKIIFLAGPKDHGAPGRHEYERDLKNAHTGEKDVKGFKLRSKVLKPPDDPQLLEEWIEAEMLQL